MKLNFCAVEKPVVILKIGTSAITKTSGVLDQAVMVEIARQIGAVMDQYHLIVVSSGAVGTGKNHLDNYQGTITERKAAAAIGNPLLLQKYGQFLEPYDIGIAQSLCERSHFANHWQFQQLKDTIRELWKHRIVPIANENDVVSNLELKFSDNDELATLLAVGFDASVLLMGTAVDGVLDESGSLITQIATIDERILSLAKPRKSDFGLGGMISKLNFARLATKLGIKTVIFNTRQPGAIIKALQGETGTVCHPQSSSPQDREKWLLSGNITRGKLQVDESTCEKLGNGSGLTLDGVSRVLENFEKGEIFEIQNAQGKSIAVARALISSKQILEIMPNKSFELATKEEIVVL